MIYSKISLVNRLPKLFCYTTLIGPTSQKLHYTRKLGLWIQYDITKSKAQNLSF